MTTPFIVPAYGAIFALFYLFLSLRVSAQRYRSRVPLGTGGDAPLERAVRTHANFAEYVPLALLLLGFLEMQRSSAYLLHILCLLLLVGRISHAIGLARDAGTNPFRAAGMTFTWLVLAVAAILLLYDYGRAASI